MKAADFAAAHRAAVVAVRRAEAPGCGVRRREHNRRRREQKPAGALSSARGSSDYLQHAGAAPQHEDAFVRHDAPSQHEHEPQVQEPPVQQAHWAAQESQQDPAQQPPKPWDEAFKAAESAAALMSAKNI